MLRLFMFLSFQYDSHKLIDCLSLTLIITIIARYQSLLMR